MTKTRAEKAQRLVDEGRVSIINHQIESTFAWVRGDHSRHTTMIYASGSFTCTCDWGENHNYSDDLCVHALAVKLAVGKDEQTMPAVKVRLQWALAQLESATGHLVLALQEAKKQGYGSDWLDAIRRARAQNDETERQVANIRANIRRPDALTPLSLGSDTWTHPT